MLNEPLCLFCSQILQCEDGQSTPRHRCADSQRVTSEQQLLQMPKESLMKGSCLINYFLYLYYILHKTHRFSTDWLQKRYFKSTLQNKSKSKNRRQNKWTLRRPKTESEHADWKKCVSAGSSPVIVVKFPDSSRKSSPMNTPRRKSLTCWDTKYLSNKACYTDVKMLYSGCIKCKRMIMFPLLLSSTLNWVILQQHVFNAMTGN